MRYPVSSICIKTMYFGLNKLSTTKNNFCLFLALKKVLVVLTDGYSNTGQVSGPALQLKNSGVVIFSVGIGNSLSMHELREMASDPADQHVITLNSFSQLDHLAGRMSSQTCNGEIIFTDINMLMATMMLKFKA